MPRNIQIGPDTLPSPFSSDDIARAEEALRQLGLTKSLIERCVRCKIPVSEAQADCTALENFLQSILGEFRGPQAPIGG
jgi:hypothetical protein